MLKSRSAIASAISLEHAAFIKIIIGFFVFENRPAFLQIFIHMILVSLYPVLSGKCAANYYVFAANMPARFAFVADIHIESMTHFLRQKWVTLVF